MFDKLYVIHCKRLAPRREYLQPILQDLGWNAEWIVAHDADEIARRHLLRFPLRGRMLTVAEISVYLKQMEAFRRIASLGDAATGFVIEDDAVLSADFLSTFVHYRAALTPTFDLAFFGASCGLGESIAESQPLFTRQSRTRSMSGYLITAIACRRLLAELEGAPILEPIDQAVDRIIRAHALEVWWSDPPLLVNGSETGLYRHSLGLAWRESVGRPGLYGRAKRVMERLLAAMVARQ